MSVGQELLNTPFPEMVQKLALAIAEAQTKLDMNSTEVARFMSETEIELPKISGQGTNKFPLIALGFFPSFYQFQEAEIEVKMAITMAKTREFELGVKAKAGFGPFAASVNATYKSKYNYSQEGSSTLRVKLAPAPPPTMLEAYMQALIDARKAQLQAEIDSAVPT